MKNWFVRLNKIIQDAIISIIFICMVIILPLIYNKNFVVLFILLWAMLFCMEIILIFWRISDKYSNEFIINEYKRVSKEIFEMCEKKNIIKINSICIYKKFVKLFKIYIKNIKKYSLTGEVSVFFSDLSIKEGSAIYARVSLKKRHQHYIKNVNISNLTKLDIYNIKNMLPNGFIENFVFQDMQLNLKTNELILNIPYNTKDENLPISTKLIGVTANNRQSIIKKIQPGEVVILEHGFDDYNNFAIIAIHASTENVIGYLNTEICKQLVATYGEGCKFFGAVTKITGGKNGMNYGCNIQIVSYLRTNF